MIDRALLEAELRGLQEQKAATLAKVHGIDGAMQFCRALIAKLEQDEADGGPKDPE